MEISHQRLHIRVGRATFAVDIRIADIFVERSKHSSPAIASETIVENIGTFQRRRAVRVGIHLVA